MPASRSRYLAFVVWQRPGTQFDAASGRLRFENGVDVPAKLVLGERGAGLFAIL